MKYAQPLDLETLLRVPHIEPYSGFDLSPDGQHVAFSWNVSGRWEIYVRPLDRSAPPQQVTTGPGAKLAPRWSPDGRQLAYVLDLDGGERYDLYCHDRATGAHVNLTPDTPEAIQPNFCWSPDGRQIAFASDRTGHFDTYVMPVASTPHLTQHTPLPVLDLRYPDWEMHWSPDGRWLAIVAETHGQDYGTFITPVPGPGDDLSPVTHRAVADEHGPLYAQDARWSPDGQQIAFVSDRHGQFEIGLYEPARGCVTWVTKGDGDKSAPTWSPDGCRLAYVVSDGPVTRLAVLDLPGKRPPGLWACGFSQTYQVEPGVHYAPRFTPDGAHLVFIFDNPRRPADLWRVALRDGACQQLTHSLPPTLENAPFALPAAVRYPSLDGQSVPALLYRPPQIEAPAPAVIYIHGGPNWLTQVTWDPLVQHMVSRGWVVLAPNYRGSTGYGREWQLANRFELGRGDTQDVVAGADYVVQTKIADPNRIVLTGRSWGGYLTMTCLTQYPERWAAGSAVVPFLNWFTSHANSREDLKHWDRENLGDPETDYALYHERSPYFFLDRVTAPVQLVCGAHDVRCPASESQQAHDALVAQGKICDLVLYPDEGHSFLKIENVIDAEKRRIAFLAEVLEQGA